MIIGCVWVPRRMDRFSVECELFDADDAGVGEDGGRGMRRASAVSGEMCGGDVGMGFSMVRMVTFRKERDEVDETVDRGEVGGRPGWL